MLQCLPGQKLTVFTYQSLIEWINHTGETKFRSENLQNDLSEFSGSSSAPVGLILIKVSLPFLKTASSLRFVKPKHLQLDAVKPLKQSHINDPT